MTRFRCCFTTVINMTRIPNKLPGNGAIHAAINALIECAREAYPREGKNSRMERGPLGTIIRPVSEDRGGGGEIPFEIYQTSTWLKYKVRTGLYVGTGNPITVANIETELTLTGGVLRYWIYIEATSTTAEVKKSATVLDWSSSKIPIGWVDTQTNLATTTAKITQFVRDHIFNPCAP